MKRSLLFVALAVVVAGGCKKTSSDGPYSGGGNPTPEGAAQAVRKQVETVLVTEVELRNLHQFMYNRYASTGQVPNSQETFAEVSQPTGDRKLVRLIQEQKLILVPNPTPEGVWAYEKDALTRGGFVLTQQGIERKSAQELSQMLGMN